MASKKQLPIKSSRATQSKPLEGYKIVICGEYKYQGHTHDSLAKLIRKNGGDTDKNIKSGSTCIFSTKDAFDSERFVINKAKEKGLTIIDTSWLTEENCNPTVLNQYYLRPPSQKRSGTTEDSYGSELEMELPLRPRQKGLEYVKSRDNRDLKKYNPNKPNGVLKKTDPNTFPGVTNPRHDTAKHTHKKNVRFVKDKRLSQAAPVSTLPEPVRKVMRLIFNQTNVANIKDGYKKNRASYEGDISRFSSGWQEEKNLQAGFKFLNTLQGCISRDDQSGISLHSSYYNSVIPSGHRGNNLLINTKEILKRERERLSSLMYLPENLKEMAPLDKDSEEFKYLQSYLNVSGGATYELEDIFRIERKDEHENFQKYISSLGNENRRLLWHGSPVANYNRIMSQGLEVSPDEVTISGHNFGKGVYLFEMSSQAASYCDYKASQGEALLLLCEAALGYPFNKITKPSDSTDIELDTTCCQGKKAFKRFTKDGQKHDNLRGVKTPNTNFEPEPTKAQDALLDYNVFICGKVAQVKLRYLVHVRIPTQVPE